MFEISLTIPLPLSMGEGEGGGGQKEFGLPSPSSPPAVGRGRLCGYMSIGIYLGFGIW